MKKNKILITGGAGFIGSEFVRQAVKKGHHPIVVDNLTYAGDLARLDEAKNKFDFYKTDICSLKGLESIFKKCMPDVVVHFAAESHVDRSLLKIKPFKLTNIKGTNNLVSLSMKYNVKRFIHISTDEVYGSNKGTERLKEASLIRPTNPYSVTKAMSESIILEAVKKSSFPAVMIRPSNCYGPWQYPEKFIPAAILKALTNNKIPVYGEGKQIREWTYVKDCASGIFAVLEKGITGEIYNLGSHFDQENLETAKAILKELKKPLRSIMFIKDRSGHDFKYCLDCKKIRGLGWEPGYSFEKGIKKTVSWNIDNLPWLESKLKKITPFWKSVYKQ